MKRLIRNISVFAVAMAVVVVAIVTSFSARSAYASNENLGNETTAKQKLYSAALASCISHNAWQYHFVGLTSSALKSDEIKSGDWFVDPSIGNALAFRDPVVTWAGGAIVEAGVTGEYKDGKIYCGENKSAIVNKTIDSLRSIGLIDIACNYKDNYATSGVFYSDPEKITCREMINGDDSFLPSTNAVNYYENMIIDKVFNNNVPGGSLYELTDLEKYYVYYDSFVTACTIGGTPNFDAPDLAYQIIVFNPSTGRFEKAGFSQKNDTNELVYTFNGQAISCGNLASMLGYEGNVFFKAYHDEVMNSVDGPIANCEQKYNEELEKIKTYQTDYQKIVSKATSFRNKVSYLLKEVDDGGSVPMSEIDELSESMNEALGQINGADIFNKNAFNQLFTAIKTVVEVNYEEEEISSEMRGAVNDWLGKVDNEITRAQGNLSTIDNFVIQNELDKVQAWKYEDDGLNMVCLADELAKRSNETLGSLPGIPDIDGTFNPGDYIDSSVAPDGGNGDAVATCYNSTSLGWILCSGIELVGGVAQWAYDYIVDNFLVVDARFLNNPNTVDAWKIFQGFANIIFVILFIIVIFSQITGIGLTNYGVKKALPKLIMVAILVNLSYIIGSMAIDLSNILGESLQSLFDGLASNFKSVGVFSFSNVMGDALSFILTGASVATLTVAGFNWQLWLPMFAIALIGMVFSIMFFFVILAVRQAGVIILLAIAPIAIVCYALPNTKNIFDRWKKMFVSLLVVYPVCGVLIGGGTFASTLLLAASGDHKGFFYNLVAMLIQVVPFFFVPTLVKGSMTAMGNIGNKISGFGSRMSGWTARKVGNSEGFRSMQGQLQRNNLERKANRMMARDDKWLDSHRVRGAAGRLGRKIRNSDTAIGRLSSSMHDQKRARVLTAYKKQREEVNANARVARSLNKEVMENSEATAERAYNESLIKNSADGILSTGKYRTADGSERSIDYENPDKIEAALVRLAQDVEDNPDDELAMIRLKGMMEVAKRKGAKGRRGIINALQETEQQGRMHAHRNMAKALTLDDKTMGALHSFDPGSESYVTDSAAGKKPKSRANRAVQTIGSMKLDNVGDMDDTFWDNLNQLYDEINTLRNSSVPLTNKQTADLKTFEQAYKKAVNLTTQAAQDPRYAGKIKSKDAQDIINEHAKQMYAMERDDWLKNTANLSQLKVTDANGTVTQAAGMDSQGYLTNGISRLVDASGNHVLATDAYSNQIKAYQDIALGQGSADLKIPRKRNIPYTYDNATGSYRAENSSYVQNRQQWMSGQANNGQPNITQLRGYDANSGQYTNASSVDADGFLLNATGQRMLDRAGGNAISANDAYDRRLYTAQRQQWLSGTTNRQPNITQLRGYDAQGNRVNAAGVDAQGFLVDAGGNKLKNARNGVDLRANDAYRNQIQKSTARFRNLRPDEQRVLDKLLDYNANIDIQHGQ